ncbi:phage tail assembly protein [Escherichia coli]|nr:phage tail assembly protein [Escherichia coli]
MKTGAEAIRALATQLPAFRQKLSDGWYQVRIAGQDVSTSGLTAQLHETLPDGAVIHIVPRVAGAKSGGVFQIVLGAAAIAGSFFTAGATLAAWGAAIGAGGMTGILFSLGASMVLGGVAQMLAPKARTPRTQTTDNGKQNTYFSSLDNMVAQGNVLPVCTVKCAWGRGGLSGDQHGRRRGWWSGCGDWSLMQNVLCETACGRFCRFWSVRNG